MGIFSGTDIKKLKGSENYLVYAVGESIYVMVPKDPPQRAIITAHGGHAVLTKTNSFRVHADTVLQFYSDDTYSVIDPGFTNFLDHVAMPREVLSEGDTCFNYILTKYQGRHNKKAETYATIGQDIDAMYNAAKTHRANVAKYNRLGLTAFAKDNVLMAAFKSKVPAVLTVRNRWFKGDVTLSLAIDALKHVASSIQVIDCFFCRSALFGGKQRVEMERPI